MENKKINLKLNYKNLGFVLEALEHYLRNIKKINKKKEVERLYFSLVNTWRENAFKENDDKTLYILYNCKTGKVFHKTLDMTNVYFNIGLLANQGVYKEEMKLIAVNLDELDV